MSDALNQTEIDALLTLYSGSGELGKEEEPEEELASQSQTQHSQTTQQGRMAYGPRRQKTSPKNVGKLHDFKNPKLFSQEHLRRIYVIYDNYCKHMSSFMTGTLRAQCTLTIEPAEESKYREYNNALPDTIMMGVFSTEPIEGDFLYNISKSTAYTIIDRLLGGTGEDVVTQEDFSEIEKTLLGNFFKSTTKYIKESWANVADVEPVFKRIETNARLSQLMPLDETVIIVMIKVKIKEQEGNISVCIPCINLENILSNTSSYALFNSRRKNVTNVEANRKNLLGHVKESRIEIAGILGGTTLKLKDLLYLQKGDIIRLEKSVESPVTVRVGNHDLYTAEIGKKKDKVAMKIKDIL